MRLQRKHDVQNRGRREQRTTRNKNTVIHGVGIAAIRNRRATWRGTCRSPTAQQPRRKPDTVSGRARKTRKWRRMQPTRLPGDRRSGGRRSRIPVRTGCGRQENESPPPPFVYNLFAGTGIIEISSTLSAITTQYSGFRRQILLILYFEKIENLYSKQRKGQCPIHGK